MGINCGIIGLPNVGKSTLFNALTSTIAAQVANYPFCTIAPNVGTISVPDVRLSELACIANSGSEVPTQISFVDIAGLVRGASHGEGLGNQFLAHVRNCDVIVHVLRCFDDKDIIHIEGSVNPLRDVDTVERELVLADINTLERRVSLITKKARFGDKDSNIQMKAVELLLEVLRTGSPVRSLDNPELTSIQKQLLLLTAKPILYVCNVNESTVIAGNVYTKQIFAKAAEDGTEAINISATVEAEAAQLFSEIDKHVFLSAFGLTETSLSRLIKKCYRMLGLITFFTVGKKETRSWAVRYGTKALKAAGTIHSDFEKGFIRAETISYEDFLAYKGEQGARNAGKVRLEGRDYTVVDGDIIHFLFNV